MGTEKQKKLAKEIVKNATLDKPMNSGAMLAKVGYAKNTAKAKPKDIIESEGVREELAIMGFTEDNAKRVVGEILDDGEKDNDRLKAADMIFKVQGAYAPEKSQNMNLNINTDIDDNDKAQEIADKYEEELRKTLLDK